MVTMRFLQVTSLFALGGSAGTVWGADQLYPRDGSVRRDGWEDVLAKPNIVVIMTDDQDLHQNSIMAQPAVQRELVAKGLTLENHFVTVAQCCPSRTAYIRGQAAHNTNLTHVFPPG